MFKCILFLEVIYAIPVLLVNSLKIHICIPNLYNSLTLINTFTNSLDKFLTAIPFYSPLNLLFLTLF